MPSSFAASLVAKYAPVLDGQGSPARASPVASPRVVPGAESVAPPPERPESPTPAADATKAGTLATLGNSFIAFVGAGILDLPHAFSKAGLGLSTFMLIAVGAVSLHCMYLVVDCKLHLERKGVKVSRYGDIGFHAVGPIGQKVVDFCLVLTQTGFCVAYLIFVAKNLQAVVNEAPSYRTFVWLCVPGQIMLSRLRHLKFLGWFSILADCTNLFGLSTIFWYAFEEIADPMDAEPRIVADWSHAVAFFGVSIYCYEGIGMVVPIQSSMKEPEGFKLIWGLNMLLVTFLFWSFGFIGYIAYGNRVHDTITLDLPAYDLLTVAVRIALCTGLYFTYPVMMFPVYEIAEVKLLSSSGDESPRAVQKKQDWFRTATVAFTALMAAAVPSFSLFIKLVGSSCCALLAFILPAVFSLKIQGMRPLTVVRESAVIVMGLTGAVIGTTEALVKIAEHLAGV